MKFPMILGFISAVMAASPAYAEGVNYQGKWKWNNNSYNNASIDFDGINSLKYCFEKTCWNLKYSHKSNGSITFPVYPLDACMSICHIGWHEQEKPFRLS